MGSGWRCWLAAAGFAAAALAGCGSQGDTTTTASTTAETAPATEADPDRADADADPGGRPLSGPATAVQSSGGWVTATPRFELPDRTDGKGGWGELKQIVVVGGEFVGFGQSHAGFTTWTTDDGIDWQFVAADDTFGGSWPDITDVQDGRLLATHRRGDASTIHLSEDSGRSWVAVPSPPNVEGREYLHQPVFAPDGAIVASRASFDTSCAPEVWRTTDGENWVRAQVAEPSDACGFVRRAGNTIWLLSATGRGNHVWASVDGGVNFVPVASDPRSPSLVFEESVLFTAGYGSGRAVGERMELVALDGERTVVNDSDTGVWGDGSLRWTNQQAQAGPNAVLAQFLGTRYEDPQYCFDGEVECDANFSQWMETRDGGRSWRPVTVPDLSIGVGDVTAAAPDGRVFRYEGTDDGWFVHLWQGGPLPALTVPAPYGPPDDTIPFLEEWAPLPIGETHRVRVVLSCGGLFASRDHLWLVDDFDLDTVADLTVIEAEDSDSYNTAFGTVLRADADTVIFTPDGSTTNIIMKPGEQCSPY